MHANHFDTLTRRATAAVSRRSSPLTLTGAAIASSALGPSLAQAGKDAKKARKRKKKKCKRQIDTCRNVNIDFCAEPDADCNDEELEYLLSCCSLLANCKAGESMDCLFGFIF